VTERDRSRTPLFQVLFNYFTDDHAAAPDREDDPAVTGSQEQPAAAPGALRAGVIAKFDVRLILADDEGGGLVGVLEYAAALFDAATAQRMAGHLAALLDGAGTGEDLRLSQLPMLTEAERNLLVREWGGAGA
jgi:non-ribosomal peptide synthetase component F